MASDLIFPVKMLELGENAFPKISGKRRDFLKSLQHLADTSGLPQILDIEGTVKLHGMHADIVFDLKDLPYSASSSEPAPRNEPVMAAVLALSSNPNESEQTQSPLSVTFQSRNKMCDPQSSVQGWPRNLAQLPDALVYLRDQILNRYRERNPQIPLNRIYPLIVAGEWVGQKVQRDVGVSQLSPRFVILSIQLNGLWQKDSDYKDIEATKAGIYSIFRPGQRVVKFVTGDISDTNPTLLEMQKIADEVEACCPFAAAFGIQDSRGEGVVWKPAIPEAQASAKYWFKTKGPIFGPENRINVINIQADAEKRANLDEMCRHFVTPRRIEQGFEYLVEMGVQPDKKSLRSFIAWIVADIWTEEKSEIETLKTERPGVQGILLKKVKWLAREAYIDQMGKCGVSIA